MSATPQLQRKRHVSQSIRQSSASLAGSTTGWHGNPRDTHCRKDILQQAYSTKMRRKCTRAPRRIRHRIRTGIRKDKNYSITGIPDSISTISSFHPSQCEHVACSRRSTTWLAMVQGGRDRGLQRGGSKSQPRSLRHAQSLLVLGAPFRRRAAIIWRRQSSCQKIARMQPACVLGKQRANYRRPGASYTTS